MDEKLFSQITGRQKPWPDWRTLSAEEMMENILNWIQEQKSE